MRDIKFRAYNKNLKCFIYGSSLFICTEVDRHEYTLSDFWAMITTGAFEYAGEYTGLKDSKGKEIYEGDIVEVNTEWQVGIKKQVAYRGDYACFVLATKETECGILRETAQKYYEVIGNIYENKELLK